MWEYRRSGLGAGGGPEKRKIAFGPPAPLGNVCFAGRKTGAAGYVRGSMHMFQCL